MQLPVAMEMMKVFAQVGSMTDTMKSLSTIIDKFCSPQLRYFLDTYINKLTAHFSPYMNITFHKFTSQRIKRNEALTYIQTYLSVNSSQTANHLKAEFIKNSQSPLLLTLDDNEQITDEFHVLRYGGYQEKSSKEVSLVLSTLLLMRGGTLFSLFTASHRDVITSEYLKHVIDEGKAIAERNRQIRLYTNNPINEGYEYASSKWSHVAFEHSATFETLALHPKKKDEILKDLVRFKNAKNYYAKIGKAWKRGYLLYGPPGTGKSTMIAAMANFLNYNLLF